MLLGVNIDHVATLRNARGGNEPSVMHAADICKKLGCSGITMHLREDRRHIKDEDVKEVSALYRDLLNLEMAATDEMQQIALDIVPNACCIVPERRQELTTEGGLDVSSQIERMTDFVKPLVEKGIKVSLFIDPEESQVKAAKEIGAPFIELHTGAYSNAFGTENEEKEFLRLKNAANLAQKIGLKVNAGHGLDYKNVHRMHEIDGLNELNIGHSIVACAVFEGFESAVKQMQILVK